MVIMRGHSHTSQVPWLPVLDTVVTVFNITMFATQVVDESPETFVTIMNPNFTWKIRPLSYCHYRFQVFVKMFIKLLVL